MKVLQVNVVYKKGSTGRITYNIHNELKRNGYESIVCYSRSGKSDGNDEIRLCSTFYSRMNAAISMFTGLMYSGCFYSTNRLISIIEKENPDIVHLQCLNGHFVNIYMLLDWLKNHHVKTVMTLHAEFMYTGGCGHSLECEGWKNECVDCPRWRLETGSLIINQTHTMWKKMRDSVFGFDELVVVAVSDWLANRAKESGIFLNHSIRRIHNGIELDRPNSIDQENKSEVRRRYGIPEDKRVILHVTPRFSDFIKGGTLFSSLVRMLPEGYQGVIVGYDGKAPTNVIGIEYINNQKDLEMIYTIADVFVITSIMDNYPTVCLEANCCGTPVVGFDVGGIKEAIGEGMGEAVPPYDLELLLEKAIYWSKVKDRIPSNLVENRRKYCDKSRMSDEYLQLYKNMINE